MAKSAHKTLSTTIARSGQNVIYKRLIERSDGLRVQIRIRSNAYQFQSSAVVEVWSKDTLSWNMVGQLETGAMKTPEGLYVLPDDRALHVRNFLADDAALEKISNQVLG